MTTTDNPSGDDPHTPVPPTNPVAAPPEFVPGQGKISAAISIFLAFSVLGGVLCLHFPELLTVPEARGRYPLPLIRGLIQACLIAAFAFGAWSMTHGQYRRYGLLGVVVAGLSAALGGSTVQIDGGSPSSVYLGIDWFVLNLLILAVIFVPMEQMFARLRGQKLFRAGFRTDLVYFFVSHAGAQLLLLATTVPTWLFLGWAANETVQQAVAAQPAWLQFLQILFLADLFSYTVHRAFHEIPLLWKFHAVHHSSTRIDWLAGSRLHMVDVILTRGIAFAPLYLLGFAPGPLYAYLTFVSFHAVFIHANVNFDLRWLERLLVTPRYHHWHHSAQDVAVNRNYAVHLPLIDRLFGTQYLPDTEWPESYGIQGDPVPTGWGRQLLYPFRRGSTGDGPG